MTLLYMLGINIINLHTSNYYTIYLVDMYLIIVINPIILINMAYIITTNIKFRICIVICMLILIGFIESYSQHNILKPIMYIIIVMIFNMLAL